MAALGCKSKAPSSRVMKGIPHSYRSRIRAAESAHIASATPGWFKCAPPSRVSSRNRAALSSGAKFAECPARAMTMLPEFPGDCLQTSSASAPLSMAATAAVMAAGPPPRIKTSQERFSMASPGDAGG